MTDCLEWWYNIAMTHPIIEQAINLRKTKGRIDIIELANSLGIKVYSTEEINVPSFIAYDKELDVYEIYVNSREKPTRKRFSIAHEIAHFIKHKDKIVEFGVVGRQNNCSLSIKEEEDADNFAAELLMPVECVTDFLKSQNINKQSKIDRDIVSKFANEFDVSLFAAIIRLRELGYYVGYIEV